MVIFHSYVSLPEGNIKLFTSQNHPLLPSSHLPIFPSPWPPKMTGPQWKMPPSPGGWSWANCLPPHPQSLPSRACSCLPGRDLQWGSLATSDCWILLLLVYTFYVVMGWINTINHLKPECNSHSQSSFKYDLISSKEIQKWLSLKVLKLWDTHICQFWVGSSWF